MNSARDEMLTRVRTALRRTAESDVAAIPATARILPRMAGDVEAELSAFLSEVEKLGGKMRRISELTDFTRGAERVGERQKKSRKRRYGRRRR